MLQNCNSCWSIGLKNREGLEMEICCCFYGMDQAVSQPGYRSGTCKEQRDRYEVGHDGRSGLMVKVHAFLFAWPYNILGHPFLV